MGKGLKLIKISLIYILITITVLGKKITYAPKEYSDKILADVNRLIPGENFYYATKLRRKEGSKWYSSTLYNKRLKDNKIYSGFAIRTDKNFNLYGDIKNQYYGMFLDRMITKKPEQIIREELGDGVIIRVNTVYEHPDDSSPDEALKYLKLINGKKRKYKRIMQGQYISIFVDDIYKVDKNWYAMKLKRIYSRLSNINIEGNIGLMIYNKSDLNVERIADIYYTQISYVEPKAKEIINNKLFKKKDIKCLSKEELNYIFLLLSEGMHNDGDFYSENVERLYISYDMKYGLKYYYLDEGMTMEKYMREKKEDREKRVKRVYKRLQEEDKKNGKVTGEARKRLIDKLVKEDLKKYK